MLDIRNITLEDEATFDTICNGFTFGIFQLESYLGRSWSKRVGPRSIKEISDLISIIRPGALDSGMADSYVEVRRGTQEINYIHPALEDILSDTYGSLVYQEQAMKISQKIAGFNLQEADKLRKAMGKKLADEMGKVKLKFAEGTKRQGYDEKISEEIFSWIDKFSEYGFNASHGCQYAIIAYQTAYMKTHHPLEFYIATLCYSDDSREIEDAINDTKLRGIKVFPPLLSKGNLDFEIDGKNIVFGIKYIKGLGAASLKSLDKIKDAADFNDFIYKCIQNKINKTTVLGLINSGATREFSGEQAPNRTLQKMWYDLVQRLSNKEIEYFVDAIESENTKNETVDSIIRKWVFNKAQKTRKGKLKEMLAMFDAMPKVDYISDVLRFERDILGTEISGNPADLHDRSDISHTCMEILIAPPQKEVTLLVSIKEVKEVKTKRGNNPGQAMAFLRVADSSYILDNVVTFPNTYIKYKNMLEIDNIIKIGGKISNTGSLIVEKMQKI